MDDINTGDMTGSRIDPRSNVVLVRDNSFVWFETRSKLMPALSEEAGHEVYKDIVMVHVQQPGDMTPASREYRLGDERRWPDAWTLFQNGKEPSVDGTPISVLFPSSPAQVKNLRSVAIHTIEQLATVSDTGLTNIPMGLTLRDKARAFLEARQGAEGFNKLQAQLDRERERSSSLELQIKDMQGQLATISAQRASDPGNAVSVPPLTLSMEQMAQIAAMIQPEKRGPGRPPKTPTEN